MEHNSKMKEKRRFSLRYKWILFICATVFISLVGTLIFTQITIRGILQDDDMAVNKNNANNAAMQVQSEIKGYEDSLEQLERLVATQLKREDALDRVEEVIEAIQQENELLISAYYMDGQTGELHISPDTEFDQDARETRTYKELTANPETKWMDVYEDIVDGKIMTSVVTPVIVDEEMVGALGYDIDLSTIGESREKIEKGSVNRLTILDAEGVVVSSFMENIDGKNMNPANSGKVEGVEDIISNPSKLQSDFQWVEDVYNDQSMENDFTWEGKKYNLYTTTIPSLNWKVISFNPQNVFLDKMKSVMNTGIISIVIGLIIGIICAVFLAGKLTGMITNMRNILGKTAEGDLTTEFTVTSNDELKDLSISYNRMLYNMRKLVSKVNENVRSVHNTSTGLNEITVENSTAVTEVALSIEEIATGATNQSEELDKGMAAIHVLDDGIEGLIGQSNTNQQIIDEASERLEDGTQQVTRLDLSYQNLESAFQKVTNMISNLDEKSKSISEVTGAISEIAEQTNLLSLNASIEAARAGEHGRGFAVVANEVRSLAEESKTAADNIQQIIHTVLAVTSELVGVMRETNQISHEQKHAVEAVSFSITDLAVSLNKMLVSIAEETKSINSIQEQKDVVVQVMEGITAVSQETTASSEEIAAAMEEQSASANEVAQYTKQLTAFVDELEKAVEAFRLAAEV